MRYRWSALEFEWDDAKFEANLRKHGIDFRDAATVFGDPLAADFDDARHSKDERRMYTVGYTERNDLLFVLYVTRADHGVDVLRLISARRADPKERRNHEQSRKGR